MWNIVRSLSINKLVAGGSWRPEGVMWIYLLADQSSTPVFFLIWFWLFWCFFARYFYVFLFFFLWGYLCRFWGYKLPLQTSKMMVFLRKSLHFWKIKFLYWKTGLGAFWHSFGLILGYFMGFLGLLDRSNWVCRFVLF